jgi:putative PIN family toxin of toxin-antitoxin system
VFLDTNVLVAAFATRGLCANLFRVVAAEHTLLIGAPVLAELRRILVSKLRMPAAARDEVLEVLHRFEQVPDAGPGADLGIGDAADDRVVACALAAGAELFVTGDKALLALGKVQALPLIAPRECWQRLVPA